MLSGILLQLDELVQVVLLRAGLRAQDIDVVVRTGGSSLIVAVRQLLERAFPGKVTEHDPFTSVASGLAIANFRSYLA
jgi:hypothetical chaperone protein